MEWSFYRSAATHRYWGSGEALCACNTQAYQQCEPHGRVFVCHGGLVATVLIRGMRWFVHFTGLAISKICEVTIDLE